MHNVAKDILTKHLMFPVITHVVILVCGTPILYYLYTLQLDIAGNMFCDGLLTKNLYVHPFQDVNFVYISKFLQIQEALGIAI